MRKPQPYRGTIPGASQEANEAFQKTQDAVYQMQLRVYEKVVSARRKLIVRTAIYGVIGGGVMFGFAKLFKMNTGNALAMTMVGATVGGFVGYKKRPK